LKDVSEKLTAQIKPIAEGLRAFRAIDQLVLVDPQDEIGENDLLSFLENHVQPTSWAWFAERRKANNEVH